MTIFNYAKMFVSVNLLQPFCLVLIGLSVVNYYLIPSNLKTEIRNLQFLRRNSTNSVIFYFHIRLKRTTATDRTFKIAHCC